MLGSNPKMNMLQKLGAVETGIGTPLSIYRIFWPDTDLTIPYLAVSFLCSTLENQCQYMLEHILELLCIYFII